MKRRIWNILLAGTLSAAMLSPAALRAEDGKDPAEEAIAAAEAALDEASAEAAADAEAEAGETAPGTRSAGEAAGEASAENAAPAGETGAAEEIPVEKEDIKDFENSRYIATSSVSITDGVLTVWIDGEGPELDGFGWTWSPVVPDEPSPVELITQSTDDGHDYAGSFKALDNSGEADDVIRIVHTNGFYVDQYMDFNVKVEDSVITENTGGMHAMPVLAGDLAPFLEGTWKEEGDGGRFLEIAAAKDNGFDVTVSDGGGRDGMTSFYTMTVYYDAIQEALIYQNGTAHTAEITDSEESVPDEETEGTDTGCLTFESVKDENGEESITAVFWKAGNVAASDEPTRFVKE